jgi:hypothetical protein
MRMHPATSDAQLDNNQNRTITLPSFNQRQRERRDDERSYDKGEEEKEDEVAGKENGNAFLNPTHP